MKKLLFGIISLCPIIAFAQPQITSISPTTGPVGTSVTITGSGFNTIADSNFVYFNDTTLASVTSATDSSLTVIVPTISSNGPIKVINLGNIDFSDQYYTYPALSTLPPPTISSFSPIQGQVGDVITINGTNFSAVPSDNIVYFGSVKAQVISSTSTQITVYLPNGIKYDVISVTVARQTAYSTFAFDVTFPVVDSSFVGSSFSQGVPFQDAGDRADSRNFADFDGDGKPDLCSINYQYVSILRNTSNFDDFSFAPAINITNNTPLASWFILPVDVDGDGKMDMVINNKNSFSVLKNSSTSGHLSFRPLKNFSTADIPRRWSDGEGLSDGSDYFGTLTGDTIVDPMQISAGDLDGDGKPDLAISFVQNGSNGFFAIYRNNTDNGVIDFSYSTILEGTSESTTIKDIDGDGKPDIIAVILQIGNSKISIYRNTSTPGNISFASRVDLLIPMGNGLGTINDNQINLADIDNDGKPDLILKDPIHDNFSVSLNQSSVGSITFAPPVYIATLDYANVSISDLNGDGKPDVVVNDQTPSYSGNISIYKNITIGSTIAFDTVIRFPAGAGEIFKICDVDMDGKPDILTQSGGFALYRNKANEPSIDSLGDPSSHLPLPAGTKQVVIKGDRFLGATSVTFNGISANSFIVDSKDQITAIVDTTAAATMRVRVESPLGIATLPVGSVYAPLANFCTSATASIIFKADNGIPPYKFQYKINGGAINTVSSGPGDSVIVHKSSSTAGTFTYSLINVTDKYGNGSKSSMNKTAVIHAVIIPPTPGAITGPTNVCSYMGSSSNAIYSIAALALANSYNWTVPAGATIISGQGTTSISVNYTSAFVSGNVAVQSVSGCMGAFKTLAITKTIPAVPGVISGPASVCSYVGTASTPIYTITAVANATSYNWTVPTGATIVSGAGTTSITVSYSTSFVPGNISVQSVSGCGSSAAKTLAITQTLPAAPTAITGPTNACPYMGIATNATYSITAVAGAASYNWTVPAGATIVAGTGTTSIDVSYSTAFVSGNVSVQSVAGCGSSAAKTLAITKTLPATPGTITGPVNACPFMGYATNAVYSIVPVSGVTTYNWTAPAGASIVSGQGTTSVNVSYTSGFVSGNISVQSVTNCGSSIAKTLAITKTAPLAPAAITGPAAVCFYMGSVTNATYSITAVAGAASYNWTVPAGATIIAGQGTISIDVSYSNAFVSGNVSVQSVSGCGSSTAKTLAITKTIPAAPTLITGPAGVCAFVGSSTNATYSITAIAGAASYYWTVPSGATIVTGQGTTSIDVSYATSFVSGNVSVQSVAGCGSSAFKSLAISKTLPAAPASITGPAAVCSYMGSSTNAIYTAAAVSGATSYNWTVPAGATIVSGAGTLTINVSYSTSFVSGNVSVQSVTICGSSALKSLAITKTVPVAPTSLTGPAGVCSYMGSATNATYVVGAVTGASSYYWTVPSGATIITGQGTTSIDVSYSTSFVSGSVAVQAVAGCGSSTAKTLAITKTVPLAPTAITGPANVCSYLGSATNATYSITAVAGASSYNWIVPTGATIVSGAGTTSINVSYSTSFVSGNVSVQSVAGCGNSAAKTLAITKTIPAAPTAITGTTNVCAYFGTATNLTYSVTSVSGADSYNWTVPAGATIISGQGTTSIDVNYSSSFVSGNVSVQSVSNCGSSIFKSLAITKTIPAVPGTINGPVNICTYLNTDVVYSIAAVSGAASYTWTVPTGLTIVSGQGTTSLTVHFGSTFSSGSITVNSNSNCGSSAAKSLALTNLPPSTGAISGPVSICALITATYSVAPVTEAVSYKWILPKGITPNTSVTGTISMNTSTGVTTITGATNSVDVDIDSSVVTTATAIIKAAAVNSCNQQGVLQLLSLTACRTLEQIGGASNHDEENSFNVYPNPSTDFFNLDISLSSDSDILLEVFNISGQKVIAKKYSLIKGVNSFITNVSELKAGTYFIKISGSNFSNIKSKVFIKE